ncbi:hypothetical protein SBA_ch1_27990 [Sphingomonas bisphenolicum]|uniref:Uncharacterized protein n=1 Tax=Sphingomonas bisphenolicum TaxID=296544 RepID=A0ABN5WE97_9SPHN|nr:hypothetical protein SBA_ch1_27990 [Sphingomonas bisphenolicum]
MRWATDRGGTSRLAHVEKVPQEGYHGAMPLHCQQDKNPPMIMRIIVPANKSGSLKAIEATYGARSAVA